ncbi:leucine/isoleucine/valine transporter ATP-binding subunit [Pseudomonas antarctica]|uniref:Leucine/isoleucine/valine transporter ATP-binding subunit n=1 Tax=Pseudomonas antarctica TaxID=219572 RepID=A0ABQ6ZT80_9PSED|nr:leucine/isoleucine/valine transporter ATP-binding subunit [Pseudomonas antarctica]
MRFGGLLAVNDVALTVKEKQVVALIGPNGAGVITSYSIHYTKLYEHMS